MFGPLLEFCESFFMVTLSEKKKKGKKKSKVLFIICLTKQKVMEYEMWNIAIWYAYLYNDLQ